MPSFRHLLLATFVTLLALPAVADAQRAPSGLGPSVAGLLSADDLGGGTLLGYGVQGWVGISSNLSLGGSLFLHGTNDLETGTAEGRRFDLTSGSLNLRVSLLGDETDLALLLSPGIQHYELEAWSDGSGVIDPARTTTLPVLGVGAGVRLPVVGPLHLEFSARDWLSPAQTNELGPQPGDHGLAHSPEFRVSLSALFGSDDPSLSDDGQVPIQHSSDFRPVEASRVRFGPYHKTEGRDHVHVEEGQALELYPVDPAVLRGDRIPTRQSVVVGDGPAVKWERTDLGTIVFAAGSAEIQDRFKGLIHKAAQFLSDHPQGRLVIRAFTDEGGTPKDNLSLAERRGTAVTDRLVNLFSVEPYRVDVVAFGADEQADTVEQSRRVELIGKAPK